MREASFSWAKRPEDARNDGLNLSHALLAGEDLSLSAQSSTVPFIVWLTP